MDKVLEAFEKQITPYLKELKLELADLEYVQDGGYSYLRVYIESEEKQTDLEDCIALSSKIDSIADSMIKEKFFLEVSTPGLERSLKKENDFIRFNGEKIKMFTKSQFDGKKSFEGVIHKFENDTIYLKMENDTILEIPISKMKKANLVYELTEIKEEVWSRKIRESF